MITWPEYKKLTFNDKVKRLYEDGSFVMAIRYYQYKVNLYLMGNFYVEVFVEHKDSTITKISLLDKDSTRLTFYSDQIKLPSELLN
ncbi:MAG: hypothetical protein O9262_12680 [Cyclobacteriaceae bacterium]|jgi:hypothetical protein|nr:hypothetical protein [Cyclobacteriaceae bacterium]NBP68415.1 hypothetical protein [Cytophagia bacterium]NBW34737.1 hypothetical protein [Cytophagia bacterium]